MFRRREPPRNVCHGHAGLKVANLDEAPLALRLRQHRLGLRPQQPVQEIMRELARASLVVTEAMHGAIVAEYFAAPRGSLGQYIATQSAFLAFERSWAAIIFAAAIGIGLYLGVVALERLVSPWAGARDAAT